MDREALIPIVDANDQVVGTALRSEMRRKNLLHRCAAVLVLSLDGERLLIHQRATTKSFWAGWWDVAVGGVVEVDEDLDECASRELYEEVGVRTTLTKIGSGRFHDADVDVFMHVWIARHDGPFTFTDGEVSQAVFVTPIELRERLRDETTNFCRDSVTVALTLLADRINEWTMN